MPKVFDELNNTQVHTHTQIKQLDKTQLYNILVVKRFVTHPLAVKIHFLVEKVCFSLLNVVEYNFKEDSNGNI